MSRQHQLECDELQATVDKAEDELQQIRVKSKQRIETLDLQLDQLRTASEESCSAILHELK